MPSCHLLRLTVNKDWEFELSRQPKVIIWDVRVCCWFLEMCKVELCQHSSSTQKWFFATMVVKDVWLHKRAKPLQSIIENNDKSPWERPHACFQCVWCFGVGCWRGVWFSWRPWGMLSGQVFGGPLNLQNAKTLSWISNVCLTSYWR